MLGQGVVLVAHSNGAHEVAVEVLQKVGRRYQVRFQQAYPGISVGEIRLVPSYSLRLSQAV